MGAHKVISSCGSVHSPADFAFSTALHSEEHIYHTPLADVITITKKQPHPQIVWTPENNIIEAGNADTVTSVDVTTLS